MKGSAIIKPVGAALVLIAIASGLFQWRMHGAEAHRQFDLQVSARVETPTYLHDDPDKDKHTSDVMVQAGIRRIAVTFDRQKTENGTMAFNVVAHIVPYGHDDQGDPQGPVDVPVGAIGGNTPLPHFAAEVVPGDKPGTNALRVVTDAREGDDNVLPVAVMVRGVIGTALDGYRISRLESRRH